MPVLRSSVVEAPCGLGSLRWCAACSGTRPLGWHRCRVCDGVVSGQGSSVVAVVHQSCQVRAAAFPARPDRLFEDAEHEVGAHARARGPADDAAGAVAPVANAMWRGPDRVGTWANVDHLSSVRAGGGGVAAQYVLQPLGADPACPGRCRTAPVPTPEWPGPRRRRSFRPRRRRTPAFSRAGATGPHESRGRDRSCTPTASAWSADPAQAPELPVLGFDAGAQISAMASTPRHGKKPWARLVGQHPGPRPTHRAPPR